MKTKEVLGYLMIGGGVVWLASAFIRQFSSGTTSTRVITKPPPPPPPQSKTSEWQDWVAIILSIYGNVKELWEPGGIFYNNGLTEEDVYDLVNPGDYSNIV